MKRLIAQFIKFGVVGGIAFLIDFGVLVFLTEVFKIDPVFGSAISFTVSVVFNYLASMRYVFSHREGMSRRREFVIFVILSVIGLLLTVFFMWLGESVIGIHYTITKIIATAIVMVFNFVSRKILLDGGGEAVEEEKA